MAGNTRFGGVTASLVVEDTVKSGDVVRVGSLTGVAQIDARNEPGAAANVYYSTVQLEGVAVVTFSGAVNQGAPIYTATAAGSNNIGVTAALTTTATAGNLLVGIALETKGAAEGKLPIRLEAAPIVVPAE